MVVDSVGYPLNKGLKPMATFTIRVELHKAKDPEDYEVLHKEMENEGFIKTITSVDNIKYHLLDAEYNYEGNVTKEQVLNAAKRAANSTGKKYSILVTPTTGRIWWNLKKVD